jgi:hypothetical protein
LGDRWPWPILAEKYGSGDLKDEIAIGTDGGGRGSDTFRGNGFGLGVPLHGSSDESVRTSKGLSMVLRVRIVLHPGL